MCRPLRLNFWSHMVGRLELFQRIVASSELLIVHSPIRSSSSIRMIPSLFTDPALPSLARTTSSALLCAAHLRLAI
jgi:hypothetical protein